MNNGSAVANRLPSASGKGLLWHWSGQAVTCAALEWRTTPAWGLLLMATPFLLALGGLASAAMGKDAYEYFTGEDGLVENIQVVLYAAALVMSFRVARRLRAADEKGIAAMYLLLGVGFFFLVGEEVSWGQRVFGWITPETLREINRQQEINLHNLYSTDMVFKWVQLLVGAYGAFLPFLVPRMKLWARYRDKMAFLVPPPSLALYFFFMFVWRVYRNLVPPPQSLYFFVSEFNEVLELILAAAFFLFLAYQLRRMRWRQRMGADNAEGFSAT